MAYGQQPLGLNLVLRLQRAWYIYDPVLKGLFTNTLIYVPESARGVMKGEVALDLASVNSERIVRSADAVFYGLALGDVIDVQFDIGEATVRITYDMGVLHVWCLAPKSPRYLRVQGAIFSGAQDVRFDPATPKEIAELRPSA